MASQATDLGRRGFLAGGCATFLCAPTLASGAGATSQLEGPAFGTVWRIVLPDGIQTANLLAPIDALLREIDAEMSPWRPDSLLSRINRTSTTRIGISGEFANVAGVALQLAEQSGGAFDPTVGPAVARWGFGPITGTSGFWEGFDLRGDSLIKPAPGTTLDLCGISKGRALDRLARLLQDRGVSDALVEIGGELLAFGRHPSGRAWHVGVEHPLPGVSGLIGNVALENAALATSGIKANSFFLGNRHYSHIVDPRDMAPVTGGLASVTVLEKNAMRADGWATALMAAGETRAETLARRNGLDTLMLIDSAHGLRRLTTGAFILRTG